MLTVYTQPNCNFCSLAVQILANNDIPFEIIDIKAHPEAGAFLKSEAFARSRPKNCRHCLTS
jgi:arsenate reductase-like glutaredoxin family protein